MLHKIFAKTLLAVTLLWGATPMARAYDISHFTTASVLASGHWVKIRIDNEGVYQFTYTQLQQMGFANPEKVHVYGFGGMALDQNITADKDPDDLPEAYTIHDPERGRLLFYGCGTTRVEVYGQDRVDRIRNPFHDHAYYFLSDAPYTGHHLELPSNLGVATSVARTTHHTSQLIEKDEQNPVKGGTVFHEQPMALVQTNTYPFEIKNFAEGDDGLAQHAFVQMFFGARGYDGTTLEFQHPEQFTMLYKNANEAYKLVSETIKYRTQKHSFGLGVDYFNGFDEIPDGTYEFSFTNRATDTQHYCAIDYVAFTHCRKNRFDTGREPLIMQIPLTNTYQPIIFEGWSESTLLLDVSEPGNIKRLLTDPYGDGTAYACLNRNYTPTDEGRVLALDVAAPLTYPTPLIVGTVANQNLHAMPTPHFLIITTQTLKPAAEQLADIHRAIGQEVAVVVQDDIFNEFSSGGPHFEAYRLLAKMLYDRQPDKLKYLLLYGPGTWDNRLLTTPDDDRLLTFQCNLDPWSAETTTAYGHDGYAGCLADNLDRTRVHLAAHTLGVGRIPATSLAQAYEVNAKIQNYILNPPSPQAMNHVLATSDDGNNHTHVMQSEAMITEMKKSHSWFNVTRAHNLIWPWDKNIAKTANSIIATGLLEGAGLFTYSGHGGPDGLTFEKMWTRAHVQETNNTTFPMAILATCDAFAFDHASGGIAETMLFKPDGGMIGVIGANRSVYMEHNQATNLCMATAYAQGTKGQCLGDIYRIGHNAVSKSSGYSTARAVNNACYNLCGDPAVPIPFTTNRIYCMSVNGRPFHDATQGDPMRLIPGTPITITGDVCDFNFNRRNDFYGTVEVEVYQPDLTLRTQVQYPQKPEDQSTATTTIKHRQGIMAKGTGKVVNGSFSVTLTIPYPSGPTDGLVNISFSAVGDDGRTATGAYDYNKVMNETDGTGPTPSALQIASFYIDTPAFADGDGVSASPTAYAEVVETGSAMSLSTMMGEGPVVHIDGTRSLPNPQRFFTPMIDNPGHWAIKIPLGTLASGNHSLTLSVAETSGLRTERTINFTVGNSHLTAHLSIDDAIHNPVNPRAVITSDHTANLKNSVLVIQNAHGETVFSQPSPQFPVEWNFSDNDGHKVPEGHYRAFLTANGQGFMLTTPPVEIPVIAPVANN